MLCDLVQRLEGFQKLLRNFREVPLLPHQEVTHGVEVRKRGRVAVAPREVQQAVDELEASGIGFATLIVCPLFLNEGFPTQEEGWLKPAAEVVRKAGGLLMFAALLGFRRRRREV